MDSGARRGGRSGLTDTGLRFALLMTVVTVSSTSMLDTVLAPEPNDTPGDSLGCLLAAGLDPNGRHLDNLATGVRRPEAFRECLSGVPAVENWKGLVATLVLLAVAAIVYWWLPRWRDLRRKTLPVETVDPDGDLAAELAELRELTGIGHRVNFRVDPERTSAGAVVYGRFGRYTVCLHAGLLALRGMDRDGFRAVVLHELAHVRNRDVDFAYSSTALWRVFVLLALLPYFFNEGSMVVSELLGTGDSPFWPGAGPIVAYSLLSGLLLVVLVHLTRADLLRRRELQADVQAASWGANPGAWHHRDPSTRVTALLRRVTTLLRTHPDWAARRGVLADPARLSGVGALQMFLTGVAGALLLNELAVVPAVFGSAGTAWLTAAFMAALLFPVLRRSVLGSQSVAGERREPGVAAGLWLGCGLMVGEFASGGNSGNEWLIGVPWYMLVFPVIGAVPAVWSAHSTRLELALGGTKSRRTAALVNGLVTLVLLWGGLRWWQQWGQYEAMGVSSRTDAFRTLVLKGVPGPWEDYGWELSVATNSLPPLLTLNSTVLLTVATAVMVLFPLLLHVCAGRTALRLRRTLSAGLAGGLLCVVAFAAASYFLHAARPDLPEERYTAAFRYVQVLWLVIILVTACLLTAAVVAGVSRRHWALRALLAAQVVQLIGYAAVFPLLSADGCLGPLNVMAGSCHWLPQNGWTVMQLVVGQSLTSTVLLSVCAALAGAGTGRAVRRYRRTRLATMGKAAAPPGGHRTPPPDPVPAPRAAPQTDPVRPAVRGGPSRLKQSAALSLCLPVLLVYVVSHTGEARSWKVPSSSSAEAEQRFAAVLDAPATASAAKVREWQALAWLTKGGFKQFERINDRYLALSDAVTEMADEKPGANGKIKLDSEKLSRLCGALGKQARDANKYFAVPDRDLQKRWSDLLHRAVRGSRDCLSAVGEGKGAEHRSSEWRERRFNRFVEDSPELMRALSRLFEDIWKVAKPPSSKPSSSKEPS